MAIAVLCSHLCLGEGVKALEPKEWSTLAQKLLELKIQPYELLEFGSKDFKDKLGFDDTAAERYMRLIERSASLSFELSNYENMGIGIITRADSLYPSKLKKVLKNGCPPIFYYAGNLELLNNSFVGYVGSRTIGDNDFEMTKSFVRKTTDNGYFVVSGGAKGVDSTAQEEAISNGAGAVAYLSDSLLRKIKKPENIKAIQNNQLLYLSVVKPDSGFNAGIAMMRNKYIYAQSDATIIIKSDYNKGGTWSGATANLTNSWCPTLCWNNTRYPGNKALIQKGALPIDENWDGNIKKTIENINSEKQEQLSLF